MKSSHFHFYFYVHFSFPKTVLLGVSFFLIYSYNIPLLQSPILTYTIYIYKTIFLYSECNPYILYCLKMMIDLYLTHFTIYIMYLSAITLHMHQRGVSGIESLKDFTWLYSQLLQKEVSNAYGKSIAICWARYSSWCWGTAANLIFGRKYVQLSVWWASMKNIFLYLLYFLCSDYIF